MVLTTVMTSQLENQQSIEQEILMYEKSKETSHPDISPEIQFLEPDVGYSNIYHRDIELGCMCEDCLKEEHKEDKYENRCIECGVDMGLENPRQLCGKTYCRNITERDDDGSIS